MATITEAALQGGWFYLEEEQPLDRSAVNFYVLRAGEIRIGEAAEVVGTYSIENDRVVITFHRTVPFTTMITLSSGHSGFDLATDVLPSSTIYTLPDGSDPLRMYGSFVRRIADFPSADDVRGRLK
jgi:hypothetical protein